MADTPPSRVTRYQFLAALPSDVLAAFLPGLRGMSCSPSGQSLSAPETAINAVFLVESGWVTGRDVARIQSLALCQSPRIGERTVSHM
jgi:hypothetical protein